MGVYPLSVRLEFKLSVFVFKMCLQEIPLDQVDIDKENEMLITVAHFLFLYNLLILAYQRTDKKVSSIFLIFHLLKLHENSQVAGKIHEYNSYVHIYIHIYKYLR